MNDMAAWKTTSHTLLRTQGSMPCRAPLRSEAIEPKARLKCARATLRPSSAALAPLSAERDALPDGRLVHGLTLTYKLDVKEEGKHTMRLPLLNGCAAGLPPARQQAVMWSKGFVIYACM